MANKGSGVVANTENANEAKVPSFVDIHVLRKLADGGNADRFLDAAATACAWRQTFETKGGLIGVGPRSVAEGDVICILFGADIPFVIRPQGAAAYSVVGECYIGPLMRGEAVQKLSSPGSGLENSWIELL